MSANPLIRARELSLAWVRYWYNVKAKRRGPDIKRQQTDKFGYDRVGIGAGIAYKCGFKFGLAFGLIILCAHSISGVIWPRSRANIRADSRPSAKIYHAQATDPEQKKPKSSAKIAKTDTPPIVFGSVFPLEKFAD